MVRFIQKAVNKGADWGARNGLSILRVSLSIIFFWFGFLKFFPGVSTAEEIASKTISWLSGGHLEKSISMPLLGALECLIGVFLFFRIFFPLTLILLYFQMAGACLPLLIFRDETWTDYFLVPTLLGQYIIKNCILISAAIVLGATMKGGKLTSRAPGSPWFKKRNTGN